MFFTVSLYVNNDNILNTCNVLCDFSHFKLIICNVLDL